MVRQPSLSQTGRHARAEFGHATVTEIGALYRALAVLCIEKQVSRILVVAGDDDPAGQLALRDALTVMVLAGVPENLRLAVVAGPQGITNPYRRVARELSRAGITTRLFASEADATLWLESQS